MQSPFLNRLVSSVMAQHHSTNFLMSERRPRPRECSKSHLVKNLSLEFSQNVDSDHSIQVKPTLLSWLLSFSSSLSFPLFFTPVLLPFSPIPFFPPPFLLGDIRPFDILRTCTYTCLHSHAHTCLHTHSCSHACTVCAHTRPCLGLVRQPETHCSGEYPLTICLGHP